MRPEEGVLFLVVQKLRGVIEAVHVLTKFNKAQYEFIFTNLSAENFQLYSTILNVHRWVGLWVGLYYCLTACRAYETSKLYREVKMRGALLENKQLKLLPQEQIYNTVCCTLVTMAMSLCC